MVNPDGSPPTFQTAVCGIERPNWKMAEDTEISRLLDTTTMHPVHIQMWRHNENCVERCG